MKIGILGAGAFGSSLAKNLSTSASSYHDIILFCFETELKDNINNKHINNLYLPNVVLPNNIHATSNITDLYNSDIIILTVPVKFIRNILNDLKNYPKHIPIIIASKGIEYPSGNLVSDIITEHLGSIPLAVLTGPSFATEIANNAISSLVLASYSLDFAEELITKLGFTNIRLYKSDDVIGCQVGGGVKNIIAIASGIVKGLEMGHNALAGLVTRGIREIQSLITAYGGNSQTAYGLSGLGDLVLTATSPESRNFSLGIAIAKNNGYSSNMKKDKSGIAEGVFTTKAIHSFNKKYGLYLPICTEIYNILYEDKKPTDSILDIMSANIKSEL